MQESTHKTTTNRNVSKEQSPMEAMAFDQSPLACSAFDSPTLPPGTRKAAPPSPGTNDQNNVPPMPASDARIMAVQRILYGMGLYAEQPDGLDGKQTKAAISKFQGSVGLEATGKIDLSTWRALHGEVPKFSYFGNTKHVATEHLVKTAEGSLHGSGLGIASGTNDHMGKEKGQQAMPSGIQERTVLDMAHDMEARSAAIAKAREYVSANPGKTYGFSSPPSAPGGKIDCSGLMRASIIASGYPDPYLDPETKKTCPGMPKADGAGYWGNGVAILVSNPAWLEKNMDDLMVGDIATFRTNRSDHKGEDGKFDHIGIVTEVILDDKGKVLSFKFIHSSSSNGPSDGEYVLGKPTEWLKLTGVYSWDNIERGK